MRQYWPALCKNPGDSCIRTCKKAVCFHAGFDSVFHTLSFDLLRMPSVAEGPVGRSVHESVAVHEWSGLKILQFAC